MNLVEFNFYERTQDLIGAVIGAANAVRNRLNIPAADPPLLLKFRRGYAEAPAWYMLQAAEFDPEPLTVEKLRVRDIYAAERHVQALLDIMASEKWFHRVDDSYHLTEGGREVLKTLLQRPEEVLGSLETEIPMDDMAKMTDLLGRIVAASLNSATGTWCLAHSRRRANEKTDLLKFYAYTSDLNAFRDDCHMAAWQLHALSGHTWEAFSYVCEGKAKNADDLFDALHYRGYTRQDYEAAIRELLTRKWVTRIEETQVAASQLGQRIRTEAEERTNTYFYTAWAVLRDEELHLLDNLLTSLQAKLQAITA